MAPGVSGCFSSCLRRLFRAFGRHLPGSPPPGVQAAAGSAATIGGSGAAVFKISSSLGPASGGADSYGGDGKASPNGSPAVALFRFLRRERDGLQELHHSRFADSLRAHLDEVQGLDLGVSQADAARLQGRSGIGYQEIYNGPDMTLCIFLLRAGAHIPLHDHPGMHVFGRHLFGKMRVISFDPEPPLADVEAAGTVGGGCREESSASNGFGARLATELPPGSCSASLRSDEILGPGPRTYGLAPDEGNVHELHALEDCAFFDIISPPYDPLAGRDCTYFALGANDGHGQCALVPTFPAQFRTEALAYRGPSFFE